MSKFVQNHIIMFAEQHKAISSAFMLQLLIWSLLHAALIILLVVLREKYSGKQAIDALRKTDKILRVTTENINENKQKKIEPQSRLSKEHSTGQGALTQKKGVNVLSPFFDFSLLQLYSPGNSEARSSRGTQKETVKKREERSQRDKRSGEQKILSVQESHFQLSIMQPQERDQDFDGSGAHAATRQTLLRIPEHYRFREEFALNIANDGKPFSFNTIRYQDYKYFESMKKKIAANWRRNAPAGAMFLGDFNSVYFPGMNRIISIKNGTARIAFLLNRQGKVIDIKILSRHPSDIMTQACYKAIEDSREFGALPASIPDEILVIPFQFIYMNY